MLSLHIASFDLQVSRDLWIVLITGGCAVVITFARRWRR